MLDRADLAILTHARQGLDPGYFLAQAVELLRAERGRRVVLHQGLRPPPAASLALLHIDLTRPPAAYLGLARAYPRLLNGAVRDIGKRRVVDGLVRRGDGYDGPVIVKTDLNHAGLPEARLAAGWRAAVRARLPDRWAGRPPGGDYRVYDRAAAVPAWVWRSPALVVQRFFSERQGPHYALNQWFFAGERGVVSTLLSDRPLVKWDTRVGNRPLHEEVPEDLRRRRKELGFDYGKFDYVVQEGRAWLLDANTTPHLGGTAPWSERQTTVLRILAEGLDGELRRAGA